MTNLKEHAKEQPAEADAIVCSLVAHLRAWHPESVAPLGTLAEPSDPNVDPKPGNRIAQRFAAALTERSM